MRLEFYKYPRSRLLNSSFFSANGQPARLCAGIRRGELHPIFRASHRKKFQLASRVNNACHYAEAFERVRGKTPGCKSSLARWYAIMRKSRFLNFVQLRETFPHADQVGKFTVFNIGGNKVRLVAAVHYNRSKIYIRHVLTHREYNAGKWKE